MFLLGQEVELVYPNSFHLDEDELKNLSFMSFPDSNSKKEATLFHFHLRTKKILPTPLNEYNRGHFWGYVYFRLIIILIL
jgi:hypothetical protein